MIWVVFVLVYAWSSYFFSMPSISLPIIREAETGTTSNSNKTSLLKGGRKWTFSYMSVSKLRNFNWLFGRGLFYNFLRHSSTLGIFLVLGCKRGWEEGDWPTELGWKLDPLKWRSMDSSCLEWRRGGGRFNSTTSSSDESLIRIPWCSKDYPFTQIGYEL